MPSLSASPRPRRSHHRCLKKKKKKTSRVQHTICAIFPHINKTLLSNLTPQSRRKKGNLGAGGVSVSPPSTREGRRWRHTFCVGVFLALNLLNHYCTYRRSGAQVHDSDIRCRYVRRPTSFSLFLFFFLFKISPAFTIFFSYFVLKN